MEASIANIRHQWPNISTLGKAIQQAVFTKPKESIPRLPTNEIIETVAPRPKELIHDFIKYTRGYPETYQGLVPFHMFPQWGLPMIARTNLKLPYNFRKIVNAGCHIEINGPLRREEPLILKSCLEKIDDNGKRAIITNKMTTETASSPQALVIHQNSLVPLKPSHGKSVKPRVPVGAKLIETLNMGSRSGLEFAILTGDFNPLHWIPSYAKSMGFQTTILHGYATMSKAIEAIIKHCLNGQIDQFKAIDIRFTAPLNIPGKAGVFVSPSDTGEFYVGSAAGGKAYMIGKWSIK